MDERAGNGTVDLELLTKNGARDAEDLLALHGDLVVPILIQENVVVKLILDLNFGPALLI